MAGIDPLGLKGLVLDGGVAPERALIETPWSVLYRGVVQGTQDVVTVRVFRPLVRADRSDAFFGFVAQRADALRALGAAGASPRLRGAGRVHTSAGDVAYLAWDNVEGTSLVTELEQRAAAYTPSEVGTHLVGLARILGQMGSRGVVHRDVSPQSVVLTPRGAQLVEPGVGEILEAFSEELDPARRRYEGKNAAPEQVDPSLGVVGPAADVFAFALLLIECMLPRIKRKTGPIANRKKRGLEGADRPTAKRFGLECPPALAQVFERALSPRAEERHAHVGELWSALIAAEPGFSVLATPGAAPQAPQARAGDVSDLARTIATSAMPTKDRVPAPAPAAVPTPAPAPAPAPARAAAPQGQVSDFAKTIATSAMPSMDLPPAPVAPVVAPVTDPSDFARTQISQTGPRMAARVVPSDFAKTLMVSDPAAAHAAPGGNVSRTLPHQGEEAPGEQEPAPVSRADGTHALGALGAMDAHHVLARTPSVPPVGPVAFTAPAAFAAPASPDGSAGPIGEGFQAHAAPAPVRADMPVGAATQVLGTVQMADAPPAQGPEAASPLVASGSFASEVSAPEAHAAAAKAVFASTMVMERPSDPRAPSSPPFDPSKTVALAQPAQAAPSQVASHSHSPQAHGAGSPGYGAPAEAPRAQPPGAAGYGPHGPQEAIHGFAPKQAFIPADPRQSSAGNDDDAASLPPMESSKGLVIGLVVALVSVLGVGVYFFVHSSKPATSADPSVSAFAYPSSSSSASASPSGAPADSAAPVASADAAPPDAPAASAEVPATPPPAVTTPFDAKAATAALAETGKALAPVCKKIKGPRGKGKAQVTFEPTGAVSEVALEKPYAKTATGACVEEELRKTSVAPFAGESRKVPTSFMILWSKGD